jgi:hypothetical protein
MASGVASVVLDTNVQSKVLEQASNHKHATKMKAFTHIKCMVWEQRTCV